MSRRKTINEGEIRTQVAHDVIRSHYDTLMKRLSGKDLVPQMFSQKLISDYEKQIIDAEPTNYRKNEHILSALEKRSGKQFEVFLKSLKRLRVSDDLVTTLTDAYHQGIIKAGGTIPGVPGSQPSSIPTSLDPPSFVSQQPSIPVSMPPAQSSQQPPVGAQAVQQPRIQPIQQPHIQTIQQPPYQSLPQRPYQSSQGHPPQPPIATQPSSLPGPQSLPTAPTTLTSIGLPESISVEGMNRQECLKIVHQLMSSEMFDLVDWGRLAPIFHAANMFTQAEFNKVRNARTSDERNIALRDSAHRIGSSWLKTLWEGLYSSRIIPQHVEVLQSMYSRIQDAQTYKDPAQDSFGPILQDYVDPRFQGLEALALAKSGSLSSQQNISSDKYHEPRTLSRMDKSPTETRRQHHEQRVVREQQTPVDRPVVVDSSGEIHSYPSFPRESETVRIPTRTSYQSGPSPQSSRGRDVVNEQILNYVKRNNLPNLKQILEGSSPHINLKCKDLQSGKTALHYAVGQNMFEVFELMKRHPTFDPSVVDLDKRTLFHIAAIQGYDAYIVSMYEVISPSRERASSVINMRDKDGDTALHHGARGGFTEVCRVLIQMCKCDVSVVNNRGQTAAQVATVSGYEGIVSLLSALSSRVDRVDYSEAPGRSPLSSAPRQEEIGRLRRELEEQKHKLEDERLRWQESERKSNEALLRYQDQLKRMEEEAEGLRHTVSNLTRELKELKKSKEMETSLTVAVPAESSDDATQLVTGMLYGFTTLKRDKLERQIQVQRSERYQSPAELKLYLELEQENTVLKSSLSNSQRRISHLENEIQQHHIRENLVTDRREQEDEENERQRYSAYRKEDLVEELILCKKHLRRYEIVALESKSYAQRYSSEVDVEKAVVQSLKGKLDLMRANWEGRIRSLHDDKRRLAEKSKHLEEKLKHLEEKVKKKGKEKILTEEEGMLAALPNILKEGAKIVLTKHSQNLREHQQEQKEREKMRLTPLTYPAPAQIMISDQERPSPLGTGHSSEPLPPTFQIQTAQRLAHLSDDNKATQKPPLSPPPIPAAVTRSAESVNELMSRVMDVGDVHFHSAPLHIVDNEQRTALKTLLRSALQLAQDTALPKSLKSLCFTLSITGTSCEFIGPAPKKVSAVGNVSAQSISFVSAALPSIVGPHLPDLLRSLKQFMPASVKDMVFKEKFVESGNSDASAQSIHFRLFTELLSSVSSISKSQESLVLSAIPCVVLQPCSMLHVSTAVMRILPLLFSNGPQCLVRLFSDGQDTTLSGKPTKTDIASDPLLKEFLTHSVRFQSIIGATVSVGCCSDSDGGPQYMNALSGQVHRLKKLNVNAKCVNDSVFCLCDKTSHLEQIKSFLKSLSSATTHALVTQNCPLRWFFLLDFLQESGLGCPDLSTVVQAGTAFCGMTADEVPLALSKLSNWGYVLYYPGCKPLKDCVIVDKTVIVDAIVDLCEKLSTMEEGSVGYRSLENGIVSKVTIEEACSESCVLPTDVLIDLLLYKCVLGLIVSVSKNMEAHNCKNFLFPALLPDRDDEDEEEFMLAPETFLQPPPEDSLSPSSIRSLSFTAQYEQNCSIFLLSADPVFTKCVLPAVTQSFAQNGDFPDMQCRSDACNRLTVALDSDTVISMAIFDSTSQFLTSESGLEIKVKFPQSWIRPVLNVLLDAVSRLNRAYVITDGVRFATLCPKNKKHPIIFSKRFEMQQGQFHAFCDNCKKHVLMNDCQQTMFTDYHQLTCGEKAGARKTFNDSSIDELSEQKLYQMVEALFATPDAPSEDDVWRVATKLQESRPNGTTKKGYVTKPEFAQLVELEHNSINDVLLDLLKVAQRRRITRTHLATVFYNLRLTKCAQQISPSDYLELKSRSNPPVKTLTEREIKQVSTAVGSRWETLSRNLRFEDVDSHLYSDYPPFEACYKMLSSWLESVDHSSSAKLALADALKQMAYEPLANSLLQF